MGASNRADCSRARLLGGKYGVCLLAGVTVGYRCWLAACLSLPHDKKYSELQRVQELVRGSPRKEPHQRPRSQKRATVCVL